MTKNNFIPSTVFIEKLPDICVDLQLVSIYDMDCYSVPQLLYRLAQKINDTITNMEHNDTALKAHLEDLQVKLEYLLGEGLTTELQKLIEKMYADGTLQSLVEGAMTDIRKKLEDLKAENVNQEERLDDIENNKLPQLQEQLESIVKESINNLTSKNELILFSHRGSSDCPENTLFSIRHALKNGFKGIEIDTRQCLSGEFVLLHDDTIDRTSNGSGSVSSKTLTELKQLDFGVYKNAFFSGVKIPTLEEALVECNKFDLILLEIKGWNTSEDIKKVAELIVKLNLENKVYCMGYNYESWKFRIREVSNKIKCVALAGSQSSLDSVMELIKNDVNSTISFDKSLANIANLDKCRQIGVEPILYTLSKSFEIQEKMNIGYKHFTTDSLGGSFYDNK